MAVEGVELRASPKTAASSNPSAVPQEIRKTWDIAGVTRRDVRTHPANVTMLQALWLP